MKPDNHIAHLRSLSERVVTLVEEEKLSVADGELILEEINKEIERVHRSDDPVESRYKRLAKRIFQATKHPAVAAAVDKVLDILRDLFRG